MEKNNKSEEAVSAIVLGTMATFMIAAIMFVAEWLRTGSLAQAYGCLGDVAGILFIVWFITTFLAAALVD